MRKSKLVVLFTAFSITACITCLSGCGKQGVEPVMAATIEEVTTVNENEDTEESVSVATEEETESIQESSTDEAETESIQKSETDETISFIDSSFLKEPEQQQQQAQQSQDQTQQQPKAETPKESPQPPVVNPPADIPQEEAEGPVFLPDGGLVTSDGVIYPGDIMGGVGVYVGDGNLAW